MSVSDRLGRLRWTVAPQHPIECERLASALGIHPVVAQVLVNRGHDNPALAGRFLDAPLEALSDPDAIIDLPGGADRLAAAISAGEPMTIYGDYDADGVTATSILLLGFKALGATPGFYIPSRFTEGYGINDAALGRIAATGGRIVISVDCGVTAVDEVGRARARGLEMIVVDHHEPGPRLPPAFAVIDPKRSDAGSPFREYSAAGLAFQLLRAVRRRLSHPDLPLDVLDLAALGTIADVVPLIDDNRILARHGLVRMETTGNLGLSALIRAAGLTGPVSAHHVGFSLGPRINAAGRLGDAAIAVRLLTTEDPAEAETIAHQLDSENRTRRELCDKILAEAVEQVDRDRLHDGPAIVLAREGWHPGVIGIVASQLVERYYRPVVMIAVEQGMGRGSARSIEALHLVETLTDCGDLLDRFGGHAMAAGLTIAQDRVSEFTRRFAGAAARRLAPEDLVPSLVIDAEVHLDDLTEDLARQLQRLAPFGAGNPEPVLAARRLRAVTTRVMSDGLHLKLGVTDGQGFADAVGFRLGDASELLAFTRAQLDLAFTVEIDRWENRERVELVLRDLLTPGVDLDAVLADTTLLLDRLFVRAGDYLDEGALGLEDAGAFHTKVAGVTFEGRQAIVQTLTPAQTLVLAREPSNPHDPHAVKVLTESGQQIGYLSARVASRLAPTMDSGARYSATVSQITGGGTDRSFGVNIYLQREEAAAEEVDPLRLLRTGWADLPAGDLLERLRVHLHRGRHFRSPQFEILRRVLAGESVSGVFGPGRGRRAVMSVAAAAASIAKRPIDGRRSGPVVIAVPLYGHVDRWYDHLFPLLRQVGVHCVRAHGALLFRQRQRLAQDLASGAADVALASFEYLKVKGRTLQPSLLLVETARETDERSLEDFIAGLESRQVAVLSSGPQSGGRPRIVDEFLRTNVRLVDRRGVPDREAALAGIVARGEKTLVYTSARSDAVEVAERLRKSTGRGVAYSHTGLPLRVREVLEQMFADGKIAAMVVADGIDEAVVPGDVKQVAVLGLPQTAGELIEQIGTAGMDGRQCVATLLYASTDFHAVEASLAERNPTREALAAIYRAAREQAARDGFASWPDAGLTAAVGNAATSPRTVGIGLDVLAEAGLIQREYDGERWRLTLGDGGRRELTTSLRYAEGEREREALADLERLAFGPLHEILKAVAGPTAG